MPTNGQALFELIFRPNVELVSIVRRFVSDFYKRILGDLDSVSRLALATHELLENAVKYSLDGATKLSITVDRGDAGTSVTIRIQNRADEPNIRKLGAVFEGMRRVPDSFEYYQSVMEAVSREPEGSGLGLARVCAEAEMKMGLEVEGDAVTIVAETKVGGEEPK